MIMGDGAEVVACPPADFWRRLHEGAVSEAESDQFEQHLSSCAECRSKVERAATGGGRNAPLLLPAPCEFGRFRIDELVGTGGAGEVYRAFDPQLNRTVAVKVFFAASASDVGFSLWKRECLAAARLQHPNVVPLYEAGEIGGRPYLVYPFVNGCTLDRWLENQPDRGVDPKLAAAIIALVARGVAAAHAVGVLHRDVKPSNVMVDSAADPLDVKLTDFGAASLPGNLRIGLSTTIAPVGTQGYMAPELYRGEKATPVSDVYSLGMLLYRLAGSGGGLLPTGLSRKGVGMPSGLKAIAAMATAETPARRYASAAALADDLERYRQARTTLAQRRTALFRTAAAGVGAVAATPLWWTWRRSAAQAELARRKSAVDEYVKAIRSANDLIRHGKINDATQLLRSIPEDLRGVEWRWLAHIVRGADAPVLCRHGKSAYAVCCLKGGLVASGGSDGIIRITEIATARPVREWAATKVGKDVNTLAATPDGLFLFSGGDDGQLQMWETATGVCVRSWTYPSPVKYISVSSDGRLVASASNTVDVHAVDDGRRLFRASVDAATSVAVTGGKDQFVIIGTKLHCLELHRLSTGQTVSSTQREHIGGINSLAVRKDGVQFASCGSDGKIWEWEARSTGAQSIRRGTTNDSSITLECAIYENGEESILAAERTGNVSFWTLDGRSPVVGVGSGARLMSLDKARDDRWLVTASIDGAVRRWDAETADGRVLLSRPLASGMLSDIAWHQDSIIATGTSESVHSLMRFDPASGRMIEILPIRNPLRCVVTQGTNELVAVDERLRVHSYDLSAKKAATVHGTPRTDFDGVAISGCSELIAVAFKSGNLEVRDRRLNILASRALRHDLGPFNRLRFFDGSTRLLVQYESGLEVLDARTLEVAYLPTAPGSPHSLGYESAKGFVLALIWGQIVRFEGPGATEINPRYQHSSQIFTIVLSPDGRTLVTADADAVIHFWNMESGDLLYTVPSRLCHTSVTAMYFSPCGRYLAMYLGNYKSGVWEYLIWPLESVLQH